MDLQNLHLVGHFFKQFGMVCRIINNRVIWIRTCTFKEIIIPESLLRTIEYLSNNSKMSFGAFLALGATVIPGQMDDDSYQNLVVDQIWGVEKSSTTGRINSRIGGRLYFPTAKDDLQWRLLVVLIFTRGIQHWIHLYFSNLVNDFYWASVV